MKFRILCFAFMLIAFLQSNAASAYKSQIISSTSSSITVDVTFDSFKIVRKTIDGAWRTDISMPHTGSACEPGYPKVPVVNLTFGIPANSKPSVSLLSEQSESRSLGDLVLVDAEDDDFTSTLQGWYPQHILEKGVNGFLRDQRIIQVNLSPVRYLAPQGLVQLARQLRFRIDFNIETGSNQLVQPAASPQVDSEFEAIYKNLIQNYQQSKAWRTAPAPTTDGLQKTSAVTGMRYKIRIEDDGVYSISGEELSKAGITLSDIDVSTLALSNKGRPVPILVEGKGDGEFNASDKIIFIGEHNKGDQSYLSFYSDTNVYWLSWGDKVGLRFAELIGTPDGQPHDIIESINETRHLEKDLRFERLVRMPDEQADHWFWDLLGNGKSYNLSLDLPFMVDDSDVRIRANFRGLTDMRDASLDHHITAQLDGNYVGEVFGNGRDAFTFESSTIKLNNTDTNPQLRFDFPMDLDHVSVDQVYLNWIEIDYQRQLHAQNGYLAFVLDGEQQSHYKLSGFSSDQVYVLTENGYHLTNVYAQLKDGAASILFKNYSNVPTRIHAVEKSRLKHVKSIVADRLSALKSSRNQADYIIISHTAFLPQAQRLADYRSTQNLTTLVLNVQDIYDEFSAGLYDPRAIQAFVKYAYENWSRPAPTYLLLFGDTTYEMNKKRGRSEPLPSYVPSMMVYTNSYGLTSSDNYFAAVRGDDIMPDLHVGRLPASNQEEADNMVSKIIDYETKSLIDEWRRSICLASGRGDFFSNTAQYLHENKIPERLVTNRVSTEHSNRYYRTTEDFIRYWNEGQAIVNFIVHGSSEQVEDARLFTSDDVLRLNNKDKYPIAFTMSCYIAHFDHHENQSLAEKLLTAQDRGVVALFGSVGLAYQFSDFYLNTSLFEAMFDQKLNTLGAVITRAKYGLVEKTRGQFDPVKNFVLLGDPATRINLAADEIKMTLSSSLLGDGETLGIDGSLNTPQDGTVLLSVLNDQDSVIVKKTVPVRNGAIKSDLLILDSQTRRAWSQNGGSGIVRAYFYNSARDAASATTFSVIRPVISGLFHTPETPRNFEPVRFQAEIDPQLIREAGGLQSMSLLWSTDNRNWEAIDMMQAEEGHWQSQSTVRQEEGTQVYYKLRFKTGNGSTTESASESYRVRFRPDLLTLPFLYVKDGISIKIRNDGETDSGPFAMNILRGHSLEEAKPFMQDVQIGNIPAETDTLVTITDAQLAAGWYDFLFQMDPDDQVDEDEELNNLTPIGTWVATHQKGSDGAMFFKQQGINLRIPAKAIALDASVQLDTLQRSFLDAANTASLTVLPTDSAGPRVYNLTFGDASISSEADIRVEFSLNADDSLTQHMIQNETVRIYVWEETSSTWRGLSCYMSSDKKRVSASLPAGYDVFALMASNDSAPPAIRIGVEGQNFVSGDMVNSKPTFMVTLEDESGLHLKGGQVDLKLDDKDLTAADYVMSFDPQTKRQAVITLSPELQPGKHELSASIADINGNTVRLTVDFGISTEFELSSVANHPNPFITESIFAFTLTDMANEVKLDVYTVSGRLIRSFQLFDVAGYQEQHWDGRDDMGNEIANGVYYLKITAKQGDKRIERIEKLAKLQ